jgi:hypothetical protein
MNVNEGQLTVTSEDTRLTNLGVTYTIKDEYARPVETAALGDTVDLKPGVYVVEVPLPSGGTASETLEVSVGDTAEVRVPIARVPRTPGIIIEDGTRKFDLTGFFPITGFQTASSPQGGFTLGAEDPVPAFRIDLHEPRGIDLDFLVKTLRDEFAGAVLEDVEPIARGEDSPRGGHTAATGIVEDFDLEQVATAIGQTLQNLYPEGLRDVIGALSAALGAPAEAPTISRSIRDGTPLTFRLRFRAQRTAAPEPTVAIEASVRGNGSLAVTAAISTRGGRPPIVEIARQGSRPTATVLPLVATETSPSPECNLVITATKDDVEIAATPASGTRAQLAAEYLQSSDRNTASTILGDLEDLVAGKESDPIAAALSCYALLRLRQHDRLHDWPSNLARKFPEMADGAIIAGELALRRGNDREAEEWIRQALGGPTPIFTDGYSILLSAARALDLLKDTSDDSTRQSLDRAPLPVPATVDFDKLTLTWRTRATPLERFPTADGWRRFRHRSSALDPQDWWR